MPDLKTTFVEFEQFSDIDFVDVATYYIKSALGYVYIHTKDREAAQEWVNENYGKGKYTVRASKNVLTQPKNLGHSITAR